jgi:hypothetical protein
MPTRKGMKKADLEAGGRRSKRGVLAIATTTTSPRRSGNNANKSARARTAVNAVCSTTLIMEMCSIRYQAKKEEAWKWEDTLTPYGIKLRDAAFDDVNYRHYRINFEDLPRNGFVG